MTFSPGCELSPLENAILRTVLYASVFDHPLTPRELHQDLLEQAAEEEEIVDTYRKSPALGRLIEFQDGFFFPAGREDMLEKRTVRAKRSGECLARHRRVLKLLCTVPFTRLVALSGSAAHLAMDQKADVDLFIVAEGKTVWSIAAAALLLTKLTRRRETVCFNYIISDDSLTVRKKDLFSANQIIHLNPLIGYDTYLRFLHHNDFVRDFYPNFTPVTRNSDGFAPGPTLSCIKRLLEKCLGVGPIRLHEWICKQAYYWYLKRKRRSWQSPQEVVLGSRILKLHSQSHRSRIMADFQRRVEATRASTRSDPKPSSPFRRIYFR